MEEVFCRNFKNLQILPPKSAYINYDLELIKKTYEAVSKKIMEMQMALDKYNQTVNINDIFRTGLRGIDGDSEVLVQG